MASRPAAARYLPRFRRPEFLKPSFVKGEALSPQEATIGSAIGKGLNRRFQSISPFREAFRKVLIVRQGAFACVDLAKRVAVDKKSSFYILRR